MRLARTLPLLAAALLLAACTDVRRDAARAHLQTHPPDGFEIVALPPAIPLAGDDPAEAVVTVRLRLKNATVEIFDGFSLPAAAEPLRRLGELRGWALGALPAGHPVREKILTEVAAARAPLRVKRVVTPAGTEIDALTSITLRRDGPGWKVSHLAFDARVPGAPDRDPAIPPADAPEVTARFAAATAAADRLEVRRRDYLAGRRRVAEQSRARLAAQLREGATFEGQLPSGEPARLVVTRGLADGVATIVLKVRGPEESSARFVGALAEAPSGATAWRAAQVATLSAPIGSAPPAATDAAARPTLSLAADETGLHAEITFPGAAPAPFALKPTGAVELIPEP